MFRPIKQDLGAIVWQAHACSSSLTLESRCLCAGEFFTAVQLQTITIPACRFHPILQQVSFPTEGPWGGKSHSGPILDLWPLSDFWSTWWHAFCHTIEHRS